MTSYKEACQVAKEADKNLLATHFNPSHMVRIMHEEGTELIFNSAMLYEWKDYVFIFTEHHGTFTYHKSDLVSYVEYAPSEPKQLEGTGYVDKCEKCQKEFKVEKLNYGDFHFNDKIHTYCQKCLNRIRS